MYSEYDILQELIYCTVQTTPNTVILFSTVNYSSASLTLQRTVHFSLLDTRHRTVHRRTLLSSHHTVQYTLLYTFHSPSRLLRRMYPDTCFFLATLHFSLYSTTYTSNFSQSVRSPLSISLSKLYSTHSNSLT